MVLGHCFAENSACCKANVSVSSLCDLKVYSLSSCSTVPPSGAIAPGRLSARRNSASDLANPFVVFRHH